MRKLTQMIRDTFKQIYLRQNEKHNEKLLDECLDSIFPTGKLLRADLNNLVYDDKNVENVYSRQYLPYHTHDEKWLAKYIEQVFFRLRSYKVLQLLEKGKINNLKKLTLPEIEKYMATSTKFNERREQYEKNVVLHYLDLFNNHDKDDLYYTADYKQNFWQEGKDLHYGEDCLTALDYRHHILDAMNFLGIDYNIAKTTLEVNADKWRDDVYHQDMTCRLMHSVMVDLGRDTLPTLDRKKLKEADSAALIRFNMIEDRLFDIYKARNEHHYYNAEEEIRDVIDEYDLASPCMKFSRKKAQNMEKPMLHMCKEYTKQYIICQRLIEQNQEKGLN